MLAENFGVEWLVIDVPFKCEIHWCRPHRFEKNLNFKVLMLHSEPASSLLSSDELKQCASFFDLIITKDEEIAHLSNVVIDAWGDAWSQYVSPVKRFELSFILSMGANTLNLPGYRERLAMVERREAFSIPLNFYIGKHLHEYSQQLGLPLLRDDRKDCLFESMFHIAIENSVERNYFTEKLVDCFQTFTLPIYIGCPNIADFFDPRGMFLARDAEDVLRIANSLRPADYYERFEYMLVNKNRSDHYTKPLKRIRTAIISAFLRRGDGPEAVLANFGQAGSQ